MTRFTILLPAILISIYISGCAREEKHQVINEKNPLIIQADFSGLVMAGVITFEQVVR